jgi:hypothetical protein
MDVLRIFGKKSIDCVGNPIAPICTKGIEYPLLKMQNPFSKI